MNPRRSVFSPCWLSAWLAAVASTPAQQPEPPPRATPPVAARQDGRDAFDPVFPWHEDIAAFVEVHGGQDLTQLPSQVALAAVADDAAAIAALAGCADLRQLRLRGRADRELSAEVLRTVAQLPNLEVLVLVEQRLTAEQARELRIAPNLRMLVFAGQDVILDGELATALVELPHLRALWMTSPMTPEGVARLAGLPNLEMLRLSRPWLDDALVAALRELRSLRTLELDGGFSANLEPTLWVDAAHARQLAALPRLRALSLHVCALEGEALAQLPPTLESLRFQGTGLTESAIRALADRPLRCLELTPMVPEPALDDAIAALVRTLPLERYDSQTAVPAPILAALAERPKLRHLAVGCPASGELDLGACAKMAALEQLHVFATQRMKVDTFAALRGLPKLWQVRLSPGGFFPTPGKREAIAELVGPSIRVVAGN